MIDLVLHAAKFLFRLTYIGCFEEKKVFSRLVL